MALKNKNIVWRNTVNSTFFLFLLWLLMFFWALGNMPNIFRSMVMASFFITTWANYKAIENQHLKKPINYIVMYGFQIILILLGLYINLFVNQKHRICFMIATAVWVLVFSGILVIITPKIEEYINYATIDYYEKLNCMNYKELFSLRVRYNKIQNCAHEIKNIIIGLYALLVGSIINFGIDVFEIPFDSFDFFNITTCVSENIWETAIIILGLLIFLQFVCGHFEAIAKQHIEIINKFIDITSREKEYIESLENVTEIDNK